MKKLVMALLPVSIALVLTGCAQNPQNLSSNSQSVDHINFDPNAVYQKTTNADQVKTKVVTRYVPVPVPGQLMPIPQDKGTDNAQKKPVFYTKEEAVAYANEHSMVTPNSHDFFNAMTTYDYMPGALYTIYTAPMRITDLVFETGERIISDAAGDTLRWQVTQTYSGTNDNLEQHILVKPNDPDLVNSMIVTTNRRVYHLVLKSTDNDTYMVSVRWHYPEDMVQQFNQDAMSPTAATSASSGSPYQLDLSELNFNYEFGLASGEKPAWYPVRVFNNGRQTFIEFPADFYNSETPVLYIADSNGHYGTMVNWRLKGRYMIVDTVIHQARLQTGIEKTGQTVVQINMTNAS